ncbi:OprD family outer membrane porin [Arcobacteraceae bacterium]|nr:OprD family outer membrane porin [Arcobacteraceae bacterium]
MKMEKLRLSMVVMATLSVVSTTNANSLKDALENGKVSGKFQAYNFGNKNVSGKKDYDITTLGFDLSYETLRINGFGGKATFQSATSPWVDSDAKVGAAGDMWGSGGQLSELYLSYKIAETTAQIGRMYLSSTLIASSSSRVNTQSYQGIMLSSNDLPDTNVKLAYVNKYQNRTDSEGNFGTFDNVGDDGAYVISVKNKSIKDLTLTTAYLDYIDSFTTTYLEAAYDLDNYRFSTQYFTSEKENEDRGYLIGIKGTATFDSVDLEAAYVTVDDAANVVSGLGGGTDLAYTWSEVFANQYVAGQDSYRVLATYNINPQGSIGTSYVYQDGIDYTTAYTALIGNYKFSGNFDGLSLYASYEVGSKDSDERASRIKLNYAF